MTYDPFSRGQYPVGVVTVERNVEGGHAQPVEVWYPAQDAYRGKDITPETEDVYNIVSAQRVRQEAVRGAAARTEPFPLLAFSHGMAGHRRQSTFLCTHLASHGYVVVSPDHAGSTLEELLSHALRVGPANLAAEVEAFLARYVADRPRDIDAIVQASTAGELGLPCSIHADAAGVLGHSFGGFTALATASRNANIRASVALAPAGGPGPLAAAVFTRELSFDYGDRVSTLYLALERDTLLPLAGIEHLFHRTPPPARMLVLPNTDHMHFADRAESSHEFFRKLPVLGRFGSLVRDMAPFRELAPAQHGYDFARACTLAHFDATLRGSMEARRFLEQDVLRTFAERGIELREVHADQKSSS